VGKRECVLDAIRHKGTGIVPYNVELTSEELAKVSDFLGIEKAGFFDWAGNYIEKCSCNFGGGYVKPDFYKDEFGVLWDRSGIDKDIGICDIQIPEPNLNNYTFPEPDLKAIEESIEKLVNNGRDTFKLAKIGLAYFERAWSLAGMENLLMNFLLEPDFCKELLEKILEYNLKIIETVCEYDIDGVYLGDDYGQQTGLIMSPQTWREFIKPGLATMFDTAKKRGKIVALHSCGDISNILSDLIDIGLDVYQTVQPEVYDLKKLKAEYGADLAFWGCISTQRLLPYATPAELKNVVNETIAIMSEGGGFIAAPTHQVPADVPAENILALVELLRGE